MVRNMKDIEGLVILVAESSLKHCLGDGPTDFQPAGLDTFAAKAMNVHMKITEIAAD